MPPCHGPSLETVAVIVPSPMALTASGTASMPTTATLPVRPAASSACSAPSAMSSLAAQMPLIVVAVLGEQRLGQVERLGAVEVRRLLVEQLHVRVLGQRLLQAGEPVLGGRGVEDALQRDDSAGAAHRLEHRVGDLLAGLLAVVGDVRDPVCRSRVGLRSAGLFHWVTTNAPAASACLTIGVVSESPLGSTFRTVHARVAGGQRLPDLVLLLGGLAVVGELDCSRLTGRGERRRRPRARPPRTGWSGCGPAR